MFWRREIRKAQYLDVLTYQAPGLVEAGAQKAAAMQGWSSFQYSLLPPT